MRVRDGRLGLDLFDDAFVQDPYPLYERMHAEGPVHAVADSGFYAVCSWDAVDDAIARPQDFSSNLTATMTYQGGKVGTFPMGELGGDFKRWRPRTTPYMLCTESCWCRIWRPSG